MKVSSDLLNDSWNSIKYIIDKLGNYFFPSTSGNVSVRKDGLVFCTPSSVRKTELTIDKLSVVDFQNNLLRGMKQTSEINLHLEIYKNFPDVDFVVHTHPLFCSIFACSRKKIRLDLLPEYYLKIGKIVYVRYITPGTIELALEVVEKVKKERGIVFEAIVLMRNHGLVVFSNNLQRAVDLSFCVEEIAKINYLVSLLGNPITISRKNLLELDKYLNFK